MAYQSSLAAPVMVSVQPLSERPFPSIVPGIGLLSPGSSASARQPAIWSYISTADALATVLASSYFSDGYSRGMRPGDLVLLLFSTSTTSSTGVQLTRALVTAYSTVPTVVGGNNLYSVSLSTAGIS